MNPNNFKIIYQYEKPKISYNELANKNKIQSKHICPFCGAELQPNGTCWICPSCGTTTGCS